MDKPLASIIVPVYNGERYLADALDSIFAQDYRPFEVIVIDDGSDDSTADIARSYKEVRYIYQTNQGHAMAKNVGISAAHGEFIAFLDADDLWAPNKLSVQVAYLLNHPLVGYTIAKQQIFLEPGASLPPWLQKDFSLQAHTAYIPGTLVARRNVLDQVGNFDCDYRHSNDSDWFFRAKDAGVLMGVVSETLLFRRFHGSNLSYETKAMQSERLKVLKSSIDRQRDQKPGKTMNNRGSSSDGK
jgi:glycosyltransferase involved in cell wall biosynthesis